jgi:hypothetical protein
MKRIAALLAFALLSLAAQAKSLSVDRYVAHLEHLHALIADGQLAIAKTEAAGLTGSEILSPRANFHADDSLLSAIAQSSGIDGRLLTRIELTIDALRVANVQDSAPDPKLLQQVAAEQDVPELARGGELEAPKMPEVPLMERVFRSVGRMFRWIGKKVEQFVDWLRGFLPRREVESGATAGLRWIVIGVVALIVIALIVLAFDVTRRARRGDADTLTSGTPLRSAGDDDPLSRGANEWERYAARLAGEGRYREGIRAWYHAVLVTCYAAGVLHFRKGRTNWEYIASLPPSTAWRSDLMRLTRRFEQEWYGADQSTEETFDECGARAKVILTAVQRDAVQREERGAA